MATKATKTKIKKTPLEETIEKIVRKKLTERFIKEDVTDTKLPGNVVMYLTKVATVLAKQKLNPNQKIAVLAQIIDDLQIDKTKLNQIITRIKGTMPSE